MNAGSRRLLVIFLDHELCVLHACFKLGIIAGHNELTVLQLCLLRLLRLLRIPMKALCSATFCLHTKNNHAVAGNAQLRSFNWLREVTQSLRLGRQLSCSAQRSCSAARLREAAPLLCSGRSLSCLAQQGCSLAQLTASLRCSAHKDCSVAHACVNVCTWCQQARYMLLPYYSYQAVQLLALVMKAA